MTAAVKLVEGLAALGLRTAKSGEFAPPLAKDYTGLLAPFSPLSPAVPRVPQPATA
jgi:allantoin racemase